MKQQSHFCYNKQAITETIMHAATETVRVLFNVRKNTAFIILNHKNRTSILDFICYFYIQTQTRSGKRQLFAHKGSIV